MPLAEPSETTKRIDQAVQQRERSISEKSKAAGTEGFWGGQWARMLGNVASPVTLAAGAAAGPAAGASLPVRLAAGAAAGAAGGAVEPVTEPKQDYWTQKAKQIGLGAVAGAGATGVGSAIGGAIAPRLSGPSQMLAGQGVQLSPGQMISGR